MPQELNQAIENLNKGFEDFKAANDLRLKELEERGAEDPVQAEKVDKINADLTALGKTIKDLETKMNRPRVSAGADDPVAEEKAAHKAAFEDWVRDPANLEKRAAADRAHKAIHDRRKELGIKAVDTQTGAAGGSAVPEDLAMEVYSQLREVSSMRADCKVITVGTPDVKRLITINGSDGGYVGETDARPESGTPTLHEVALTFGTIYAYPKATEESLQDMFFDVEDWLKTDFVNSFDETEGEAFVSGNGTNKPTGFLAGTPVATGDASRAAGVLQFFASGVADDFPATNPGDYLLTILYGLQKKYRKNAKWRTNSSTLGDIRKWKDGNGNYLWQPSFQAGQPSQLLGYDLSEDEAMPDIAANAFPIAFGDWMQGYLIADIMDFRLTRDEITTPGYVKFYGRRRHGGKVLDSNAIKLGKMAV